MLPRGLWGCMRRREFIKVIAGSVVAWPLAAQAQQPSEIVPKVGFVYPGAKKAAASRIEAIMSGLRVSGYAAPAQIELVARTAEGESLRWLFEARRYTIPGRTKVYRYSRVAVRWSSWCR